jgi:hypothetical protein
MGQSCVILRARGNPAWSHREGSAFTAQIANAAGVAAIGAAFFSMEAARSARLALIAATALFTLSIATCAVFLAWMRRAPN